MNSNEKILVQTLQGKKVKRIPFWFMRQAGRYLPEYKELRSKHKNFLEYCYTPTAATEATLQPIKRFGMDAAIIFSDILVIPHAMGIDVRFEEGRGPILTPVRTADEIRNLKHLDKKFLSPVYQALALTKSKLPEETSLIGFAGLPWTLACYMIEGGSSKEFSEIKKIMQGNPELFSELTEKLIAAITDHVLLQIEAGAEIIQLFDSWAGILSDEEFTRWSVVPTKKIVDGIRKYHRDIPIIGFPRQAGVKFLQYAKETGVNAVSIDNSISLEWARSTLQPQTVVQGCLSNEVLTGNVELLLKEAREIINNFKDKPFVFNLGHGILPHTPVQNVQALCDYIKQVVRN
ncbi:MAG: uroporphyrinogen decarboxylase [Alphaproteobacteria bacterium]